MEPLFTVGEIAALTNGRLLQGDPESKVTGFTWDSRLVKPGDCFVAMPGERVDGHDYAAKAAAMGAACILCGRPVEAEGAAVVVTPDPLIALGTLGRAHRERFSDLTVVGVTGSVGKTTTKEMVAAVLGEGFCVFRSKGNLNSEVGLPTTLMELTAADQVAVLEMGMRALGEIDYLASIARPALGIVTNVGITHLELLGTQANIARAKSELVRSLPAAGHAVLNADDPYVRAMAEVTPAAVWFYGESARGLGDRWVTAVGARPEGEMGQRFTLVTSQGEVKAHLPAPGKHNLLNAMGAAAVGLALGMDLAAIARGLSQFANAGNRMRLLRFGSIRVLDDTYNAAPASVIAALGVLREQAASGGRCVAVLGDMYELGALAEEGHRDVGAEAGRQADLVVAVGDMARYMAAEAGPKGRWFADKQEAVAALIDLLQPGDLVLVKGSRGMKMEEIVQALQNQFEA